MVYHLMLDTAKEVNKMILMLITKAKTAIYMLLDSCFLDL